jgi:hypothetical protein
MYYPYLRGKQFELIALREFSQENPTPTHVCPIIEPVKASINSLKTAINTMIGKDMPFALVLNPHDGDFRRTSIDLYSQLEELAANPGKWIPAFIYKNNLSEIKNTILHHNLSGVMIVFSSNIDTSDVELMDFLSTENVEYIVAEFSKSARRKISHFGKLLVRLDDKFPEKSRNADYLYIPEESFSDEYSFYMEEGYAGFSDYTTLPSTFKESGMLPYAIAIHMTYRKNEEEIFVRHFVSDTNDDTSNIQRKFFEAANKLSVFYLTKARPTPACEEIIKMLGEGRYPGLGVLKKLSIKNHLQLIEQILSE